MKKTYLKQFNALVQEENKPPNKTYLNRLQIKALIFDKGSPTSNK